MQDNSSMYSLFSQLDEKSKNERRVVTMDFQEWLEQPCDEAVVCGCEHCGDVIYEGEECIFLEHAKMMLHEDCYCDFVRETLRPMRVIASSE